MRYDQEHVLQAFRLYTELAQHGVITGEYIRLYKLEEPVRSLVDNFAATVECAVLLVGTELYMIPKARLSPFHVTNDYLKRTYLKSGATNTDLYLLYFCTIVLLGCFYDSYHSTEPTLSFISTDQWLAEINKRMDSLKEHDPEQLKEYEKEYSYRWTALIEKWDGLDDVKETAKRQIGNTLSRLSFLDTVKRFLLDQEIVTEIGQGELTITEKTKVIVQRFFMEQEFNRGILQFIYQFEEERKEVEHA